MKKVINFLLFTCFITLKAPDTVSSTLDFIKEKSSTWLKTLSHKIDKVINQLHDDFKEDGEISIENQNGSIDIQTWNEPKIAIKGVVSAKSKDCDGINIEAKFSENSCKIKPSFLDEKLKKRSEVNISFLIPKKSKNVNIETVNGNIQVSDLNSSSIILKTTNGEIKVINSKGNVTASTLNGRMKFLNSEASLNLKTINGLIDVQSQNQKDVIANATNGNIKVSYKDSSSGPNIALTNNNGAIQLSLPETSCASVKSKSLKGTTCEFPITLASKSMEKLNIKSLNDYKKDMDFSMGKQTKSKKSQIYLSSGNGNIKICKNLEKRRKSSHLV